MSRPVNGGRLGDERQDGFGRSGQKAGVGDGNIEASTHGLVLNRKLLHILERRKSPPYTFKLRGKNRQANSVPWKQVGRRSLSTGFDRAVSKPRG
jgi:hypothetical protein